MPGRQTTAGLADFNNDGHADVYASWTTGPSLYACLGDGEGSFTKEVINLSGAGPDLHALAVGDLNGDARADIVTGSGGLNEPNGFQVLLELAPAEPIVGTSKDDVLTGTARGEAIEGLAGDDVLQGLAGADSISAGEGCDLVSAGERNPSQGRR
jgi:Ca2+-binding RTX toxin-like protein